MGFLAGPAARARQPAVNLALVLKHVQVPPDQILCVIVAKRFALVMRTALRFPQLSGFLNVQSHQAALGIKTAGAYLPLGA